MHMSNKIRTTLTLNRDVVNRAKELDINISAAAERGIIEYINTIENLRRKPSNFITDDSSKYDENSTKSDGVSSSLMGPPSLKEANRRELFRLFTGEASI